MWMLQTHNFALFFLQNFEGEEHSVLYISRNLSPTKKLYAAMEREALTLLRGFSLVGPSRSSGSTWLALQLSDQPCPSPVNGKG